MNEPNRSDPFLLIKTAIVLAAVAISLGFVRFGQMGKGAAGPILFLIIPIAASLLYTVAGLMVPSLFATRRLAFPLPLTLPIVYCTMIALTVTLGTNTGNPLFALPSSLRTIREWVSPATLGALFVGQCASLSILTWIELRIPVVPKDPESDRS